MAVTTVTDLVDTITQHRLLLPGPLQELTADLQTRFDDPKQLARELADRGWLSTYQISLLLQGRVEELELGPYLLVEPLGESTTDQVYRARHRVFNRIVALRVINHDRLTNPEALQLFHREIQAAAQLEHPNLVVAYDADSVGDRHFFSMEYAEGINLDRLVRESGPLPIEDVCEFVRQVAAGLQHAYERGMLHGDLKPSNLILARKGGLADKGGSGTSLSSGTGLGSAPGSGSGSGLLRGTLVKVVGLTHLQPTGRLPGGSSLSVDTDLPGSPDFLAPERGSDPTQGDIRSDLYSLGCTFYYLLTGWVPFPGGTVTEKLEKHRTQAPLPIAQLRPDVPADAIAIVDRLMAKRPEDRYQTPADVVRALTLGANVPPEEVARTVSPAPAPAVATPQARVTATPRPKLRAATTPRPAIRAAPPARAVQPAVSVRTVPPARPAGQSVAFLQPPPGRRYVLIVGLLSAGLLFAILALVWALFLRPSPRRREVIVEEPRVPGRSGMRYVRGATRVETILATLRTGGLPTLDGTWYYIGPFDNPDGKGFDIAYPPEKEIDLKKTYPGKGGQVVGWKEYKNFRVGAIDDLAALFPNSRDDAVIYLFHEIDFGEALELPISLGSDDTLTVWLNGRQLLAKNVLRACMPDQEHATLSLHQGKNQLLLKVCQGKGDWAVYVAPEFPKVVENAYGGYLFRDFPPGHP
jgi:serine/threonine protein kinase